MLRVSMWAWMPFLLPWTAFLHAGGEQDLATGLRACFREVDGEVPATRARSASRPFRVVSYNVLVGYGDYRVGDPYLPGAERKAGIHAFLVRERPDVVAFQELNGYTEARLREEAAAWNHAHAVLLKPSGYPVGITSRWSIEVVERVIPGMHHGLLHVRTAGIDFIVVHLWPFRGERRLTEVGFALERHRAARAEKRPVVVLGDFNAVSRDDLDRFDQAARERYARWNWETDEQGRPITDVIDACIRAGLVDLWPKHRAPDAIVNPPRVDYVLVSEDLAARSLDSRWLAAPERLVYSDHPAVVADFDLSVEERARLHARTVATKVMLFLRHVGGRDLLASTF